MPTVSSTEAVERQTRVVYTTDEDTVDKHLRSVWFEDLEEIGGGYKIDCRIKKINNKPALPDWHCRVSAGQATHATVPLRLLRLLRRQT